MNGSPRPAPLRAGAPLPEALLDAMPDPALWLDASLVVRGCSGGWQRAFGGLPLGEALGAVVSLREAGEPVALPATVDALPAAGLSGRDGRVVVGERRLRARWSLVPVGAAGAYGALLTVAELQAPAALRDALEEARAEAEMSRRNQASRGRFLANMSHELRTPLNAILGYAELLLEDQPALDELGHIHSAGQHLLALIDDILDLSRVDAGRMSFVRETVDVRAIIDDLLVTMRPALSTNGNELRSRLTPLTATADARRVRQCLLNLMNNAVKFTRGGVVTISCARRGRFADVDVCDTGVGIHPQDLAKVFQAFGQVDALSGAGTGLGLPLTRALARGMGGDLLVTSVPGQGSCFTLRLPAVEAVDAGSPGVA